MNISDLIARIAGQATNHALPFSGPVAEAVVAGLLSVQDEQLAILRKLESTVQRLADVLRQVICDTRLRIAA